MTTQTKPVQAAQDSCVPALLPKLTLSGARELAAGFRALADPTRVQILCLLLDADERGLCVCDIGLNFPLGQPTISHHLKVLKDAGLACARREGLWVFYAVNRQRLGQLGIALPRPPMGAKWPMPADRCCDGSDSGEMP